MKNYLIIFFLILFITPVVFKNISATDYEIDGVLDGFGWSMGLSLDGNRIYVSDGLYNKILVFDTLENIFLERISLEEKSCAGHIHGMEIMTEKIFVVKENQNCIAVFDLTGGFLYEFGKKGDGQGEFNGSLGIKINKNKIFVTDSGNNRIQVFDLRGGFADIIDESFNSPHQISLSENKIYVLDTYNYQVKIFSNQNQVESKEDVLEKNDFSLTLIIILVIITIIGLFMIFLRKKLML